MGLENPVPFKPKYITVWVVLGKTAEGGSGCMENKIDHTISINKKETRWSL